MGLTARVLPALYLFVITAVAGVVIGHAGVTLMYRPKALGWVDALAIPLLFFGLTAFRGHRRALEEHTEEEYLVSLRKGVSPYVIAFIAVGSLVSGLVTGGIYAIDSADRKMAEAEATQTRLQKEQPPKPVEAPSVKPPSPKQVAAAEPKPSPAPKTAVVNAPSSQLMLKSIIGDSTRRTALINSTVLGEGQSAVIKAEGNSYQVKCVKIDSDKVTLEVEGLAAPLILNL